MSGEPLTAGEPLTIGVRERRKLQIRASVLEVAVSLFGARGYENVTVAEIADAANISVKTLFTYFRSKEDLAFGEEGRLREEILASVRQRAIGESPVDAVARLLARLVADGVDGVEDLEGMRKMVEGSPALQSRLRRMWEEYEDALAALLAREMGGPLGAARARLAASQLIALVRSLTSDEVRAMAARYESSARRRKELTGWVAAGAAMVRDGLGVL